MDTLDGSSVCDLDVAKLVGIHHFKLSVLVLEASELDDTAGEEKTVPACNEGAPYALYVLALDDLASQV